jgi:hypothetical protein
VSAASIVAKVTRDRYLEQWNFQEERYCVGLGTKCKRSKIVTKSMDSSSSNDKSSSPLSLHLRTTECDCPKFSHSYGSGYPSDPSAKKWLLSEFDPVFGYPVGFVRQSWETVKKLADTSKNSTEDTPPNGAFVTVQWRDDNEDSPSSSSLTHFFGKKRKNENGIPLANRPDWFQKRRLALSTSLPI